MRPVEALRSGLRPHTRSGRSAWTQTAIAALAAALPAGAAAAAPVQGIRPLLVEPVAVRGGVLMVPLTADLPGTDWPAALRLTLAGGRRVEGLVAWVTAEPSPPRWTAEPAAAAVRAIAPDDDTAPGSASGAAAPGAPYLLARLPADGDGEIRLAGGHRLRPRWLDAPSAAPRRAALAISATDDRPDPRSPQAHWRWALLADRLGLDAPSPERFGDGVERLLAEHYAALWRGGLARLESTSPGVASACRDLLTASCLDGDRPVAAWVADPRRTGALLTLLLDREADGSALVDAALRWADEQDMILVWPEPGDDRRVIVAFANPSFEPAVATLAWDRAGEIPIAVVLAAGRVSRAEIDRPPPDAPDAPVAAPSVPAPGPVSTQDLFVDVAGRSRRLAFHRPLLIATPPGVFFPALQPPMTLLDAQTVRSAPISADRATLAHLRRREGRWEIFFECRRPAAAEGARSASHGVEAITLLLGADGAAGPVVALTVPEEGSWQVNRGANDASLEVHRRSAADRWLCRIVLPGAWLPATGPLLVGMRRSHGDGDGFETGPYRSLPWRDEPGRAAIDLGKWDLAD